MYLKSEVKTDIRNFINMELPEWKNDADEYGYLDITFATNDDGSQWNYQTGDNSYSGACYSLPHWAIATIDSETNNCNLYIDIVEQLTELLPDNR